MGEDEKRFENKIYCCSNTTISEIKKLALFDAVVAFVALIFSSWATITFKVNPDFFRNMTDSKNHSIPDIDFLLSLDSQDQDYLLTGTILWCLWALLLGLLLFWAAQKANQCLLILCFGAILLEIIASLFILVLALMYLMRKIPLAAVSAIAYLYKWYELWILFNVTKELRNGIIITSSARDKSMPAFVVNSPSPISNITDPNAVFTIGSSMHSPILYPKVQLQK